MEDNMASLNVIDEWISTILSQIAKIEIDIDKLKLLKKDLKDLIMIRHKRIKQLKIQTKYYKNRKRFSKKSSEKYADEFFGVKFSKLDKDYKVNTSNGRFIIPTSGTKFFKVQKLDIDYMIKKGVTNYLLDPNNEKFVKFYTIKPREIK